MCFLGIISCSVWILGRGKLRLRRIFQPTTLKYRKIVWGKWEQATTTTTSSSTNDVIPIGWVVLVREIEEIANYKVNNGNNNGRMLRERDKINRNFHESSFHSPRAEDLLVMVWIGCRWTLREGFSVILAKIILENFVVKIGGNTITSFVYSDNAFQVAHILQSLNYLSKNIIHICNWCL